MSLEADLYKSGQSIYQIAPQIGISPPSVWHRLKRQGVPTTNRRKAVNEAFFDSWTPEMAYVVGILATDGTVSKPRKSVGRQVELTSKDKELVTAVRGFLQSEHKIRPLTIKGPNTYYRLSITSTRIAEAVERLGIVPNKSLTLDAIDVPKCYFGRFLAGVIDGDGSVGWAKGKYPYIQIGMGAGKFIDFLRDRLATYSITGSKCVRLTQPSPLHILMFNGKSAQKVADLAYRGHTLGLTRKRDVALSFCVPSNK